LRNNPGEGESPRAERLMSLRIAVAPPIASQIRHKP
jgi:hypothetical protein